MKIKQGNLKATYFITYAMMFIGISYSYIFGYTPALYFFMGFLILSSMLNMMLINDNVIKSLVSKGALKRIVPKSVSFPLDLVMAFLIVYVGFITPAFFWLMTVFIVNRAYDIADNIRGN